MAAEDEEEDIFMETKSINVTNADVRQKLNFLDVSYEDDISSKKGSNIGQDADNRNSNENKLKEKTSNESSSTERHFIQDKRGEKTSEVHTPVAKTSGTHNTYATLKRPQQ